MSLRTTRRLIVALFVLAGVACEKVDTGIEPDGEGADFSTYVAMGTSVSMGYLSDGVLASSQQVSWPKLLANDIGVAFTLPLIESPGCRPPLAAPLAQLRRIDGTSALTVSTVCAPNSAGVTLPTQNVAVTGHTTVDANTVTPSAGSVAARVLGAGQTQVTAMKAQNPTFVSVELGSNEVLSAISGLVATNVTITPIEVFSGAYQAVIAAVKQTGAGALLVTLPTDVSKFPAVRTGAEISAQRAAFLLANVSVNSNCDTSPNLVTIAKIFGSVSAGAIRAASGLSPFDLSCADVPSTADGILSPAEVTALNSMVAQINTFIAAKVAENGYATMSLGVLYDTSKTGVTFDLASILTSTAPFGPNISLDGVHPSAAGHAILAAAAKSAITARYGSIVK